MVSTFGKNGTSVLIGLEPYAIHWMAREACGRYGRICITASWLWRLMPIVRYMWRVRSSPSWPYGSNGVPW